VGGFSAFVERRWGSWGILILSFLAVVLAMWSFANLLLLSALIRSEGDLKLGQGWIWIVFILNALLGLTFAASAYGLWKRHNWGRLLFIAVMIVWLASYVAALFVSGRLLEDYTIGTLILNTVPLIGGIAAILYLNLAHIKILFARKELTSE
jgi:hypothetical protein